MQYREAASSAKQPVEFTQDSCANSKVSFYILKIVQKKALAFAWDKMAFGCCSRCYCIGFLFSCVAVLLSGRHFLCINPWVFSIRGEWLCQVGVYFRLMTGTSL